MLNHVALPTADPQRGARFYCDVLGFEEMPRPAFPFRGSWLLRRETGVMIHLIHDETGRALRPPQAINPRGPHVALFVPDYDAAIHGLRGFGIAFVERVLPDYGFRQVFFHDPDGNVIELGEWPAPAAMFPANSSLPKSAASRTEP
jgi:catechol 2,3-dioxygenase-like lactoylglutathione lyase family enzyme